jgi:hypothetical protein
MMVSVCFTCWRSMNFAGRVERAGHGPDVGELRRLAIGNLADVIAVLEDGSLLELGQDLAAELLEEKRVSGAGRIDLAELVTRVVRVLCG